MEVTLLPDQSNGNEQYNLSLSLLDSVQLGLVPGVDQERLITVVVHGLKA